MVGLVCKQTMASVGKKQSVVRNCEPQRCLRGRLLDRDEASGPAAWRTGAAQVTARKLVFSWPLLFASEKLALEMKVLVTRPAGPRCWRLESCT